MLRAVLVVGFVLALAPRAWAGSSVGVVVTGDKTVQATAQGAVGDWLAKHKFTTQADALDKDGVGTLANCLSLADMACAHGVIEKRAKVETVVVLVAQASGPKNRDVQLSAYWISRYSDVVSLQRTCRACAGAGLPPVIDVLMSDLSRMVPAMTGKLDLKSTPAGLIATVDGETIGVTPVVRDVTAGPHKVSITRDGKTIEEREVTVTAGETVPVAVTAPALPPPNPVLPKTVTVHRSRVVPALIIGAGLVAAGAGIYMYAEGGPTGKSYYYRDYRTPGIAVAAGGGVLALVGTILFLRGGATEVPVVGITHDSASIGWAGRF